LELFIILAFFHPCLQDFSFPCFLSFEFNMPEKNYSTIEYGGKAGSIIFRRGNRAQGWRKKGVLRNCGLQNNGKWHKGVSYPREAEK
jgi:hypothetical protein